MSVILELQPTAMQLPHSDLPYLQKPLDLIETTFQLFKYLPEDSDERWLFLQRYHEVKSATDFKPINFANAWGATYLSHVQSFRTGYVTTSSIENNLQRERALDNLSELDRAPGRFASNCDSTIYDGTDYELRLAITDRLTVDPTKPKPEITPCPEALYQLRLFRAGIYLARVGFNLHAAGENHETGVLSITNIQGRPGARQEYQRYEKQFDISPFNDLARRALEFAGLDNPTYETRGLINPKNGNSRLYWGVLEQEDIPMFHALRETA